MQSPNCCFSHFCEHCCLWLKIYFVTKSSCSFFQHPINNMLNWTNPVSTEAYRKVPKFSGARKFCLKFKKRGQTYGHFVKKVVNGIANSGDPDQTSPLGAVWSGSALFAYTYQSEKFGSLKYLADNSTNTSQLNGGRNIVHDNLTLKAPNTTKAAFANSVDPDDTTHNASSHLDLQCLPSSLLQKRTRQITALVHN